MLPTIRSFFTREKKLPPDRAGGKGEYDNRGITRP